MRTVLLQLVTHRYDQNQGDVVSACGAGAESVSCSSDARQTDLLDAFRRLRLRTSFDGRRVHRQNLLIHVDRETTEMNPDVIEVLETIHREGAFASGRDIGRRYQHSFRASDFHDRSRFLNEKPCHSVSGHSYDHEYALFSILYGDYDRPSPMHVLTHRLTGSKKIVHFNFEN